jgi:hypothetical protein
MPTIYFVVLGLTLARNLHLVGGTPERATRLPIYHVGKYRPGSFPGSPRVAAPGELPSRRRSPMVPQLVPGPWLFPCPAGLGAPREPSGSCSKPSVTVRHMYAATAVSAKG